MKEMKEMEITLIPREKREKKEKPEKRRRERAAVSLLDVLLRGAGLLAARAMPLPGAAPFGLAFLAMERRFSLQSLLSLLLVSIGYLTLGRWETLRYIGACAVYEALLFFLDRREELSLKLAALCAGALILVFDLGAVLLTGASLNGLLLALLDTGLALLGALVFDKARVLLAGRSILTQIPSAEEKLSLCVMAGIALLSFQGLTLGGVFSLANALGLLAVGLAAVSGGLLSGTVAGLAAGLLLGLGNDLFPCLAVFGLCGLAGGLGARLGKYGAAVGLGAAGLFLAVYGLQIQAPGVGIYEPPAAALALALLPPQVFQALRRFTNFELAAVEAESPYKKHVQSRLNLAAASFEALSDTFVRLSDKPDQVDMQDISLLFDSLADRVCRNCHRADECWRRDFNATYKTMFKFLEILERKGVLQESDAGAYFSGRCVHLGHLIRELNRLFEIYKINQVWKHKLCENRELVGEQFHGVAQILTKIAGDLDQEAALDRLAAEEIQCRLEARGIKAQNIEVVQALDGRRTVRLRIRHGGPGPETSVIAGVLKTALGAAFVPAKVPVADQKGGLTLQFTQAPDLHIAAGFACAGQAEESGDSHMLNVLRGGKFIATLSDGMGTGRRASRESNAIVALLEDFMDAGFDKTVAVKLINSVMVMKSANEAFATVDMCMIDLYTGEAEFIKNGAEPSYIKRAAGTETVRAASLPVGVVPGVEIETFAHRLEPGDTVVMVSDGMEIRNGHEGWLRQTIEQASPQLPVQELADQLLEKSVFLKGGQADDDMTVIVLRPTA